MSGKQVGKARKHSKNLWLKDKWPQATRKLSWLIEKFRPIPDWHSEEEVKKANEKVSKKIVKVKHKRSDGTVYYTTKVKG